MKVIKATDRTEVDNSHRPIFEGGKVVMNPLIGENDSGSYRFNVVNFEAGARTKFHTHTCDQILYVTRGSGLVGTRDQEVEITEGDTALIPAGEEHRHGANDDSAFSHISLQTAGCTTDVMD
jgi:quercetin dioxygenase-like cupin family protein